MRRQIERNGLTPSRISFTDGGLRTIISDYTREAGVRQLEREIGTVCRRVARQVAEGTAPRKLTVTEPRVRELLGKRRFFSETRGEPRVPGWPPAWRGRRWAARCCSSRRARCPVAVC